MGQFLLLRADGNKWFSFEVKSKSAVVKPGLNRAGANADSPLSLWMVWVIQRLSSCGAARPSAWLALNVRRQHIMHSHRNWWLLLAVILIAALSWLGLYLKRTVSAPKVATTFWAYTKRGSTRFEFISFANRERVPIQWRSLYIEEAGKSEYRAPIFNPHLPWISAATLESGESETIAIGCPDANARWRACWDYQPLGSTNIYVVKSRWFEP